MDEFEDGAFVARPAMAPTAGGSANARKRTVTAAAVSRIDRAANEQLAQNGQTVSSVDRDRGERRSGGS
jgi:hypothetical protein